MIVRLSSSRKTVSWEEHRTWIADSIINADRQVYIIYTNSEAIGQVRFDRTKSHSATISVYLLSGHTGKGLGVAAIETGIKSIFETWRNVKEVLAFVRADNVPSQKAFRKAGFALAGKDPLQPKGHLTLKYDVD